MSRCTSCGHSFDEENGWQEFCSVTCAMQHICGRSLTEDDVKSESKLWKKWLEWHDNPKNKRLVRDGEPAQAPKYGGLAYRLYDSVVKGVKVKVKRDIVMKPRPLTDKEREQIAKYRGRGGFGECHVRNCMTDDIPSQQGMKRVGEGWFPHD